VYNRENRAHRLQYRIMGHVNEDIKFRCGNQYQVSPLLTCNQILLGEVRIVMIRTKKWSSGHPNRYVFHVEITIVIKTDFVACDVLDASNIWVPDSANGNCFQRGKDNMELEQGRM
jgi:hypothetical protein